jgi:CRISPR-associated protein Csm1
MNMLDASCKVAFAAMIHDLGKFAQRTEKSANTRFGIEKLEANSQQYCRFVPEGQYWTHRHAAYTALAFDELEEKFPDMIRSGMYPFADRNRGENITDSLVNAAAAHHKPDSFLQWVVAVADRTASGFEREEFEKYNQGEDKTDTGRNHYQARLLSIFERLLQTGKKSAGDWKYRYPLRALSAKGIFPGLREVCEPCADAPAQAEYAELWTQFTQGLEKIPASHRASWPLWLDHFDSLWLTFTQAIPSATAFGVRPDVSLYDHSKASAALAVALWRWHQANGRDSQEYIAAMQNRDDWDEKKFLLIRGDFFGVQDFIFAEGGETNKPNFPVV